MRGVERLRMVRGFLVARGVVIADHDREALARLCRYGARPALGLPCTPATFAPARAPPQAERWFDDAS